jgi:hypothetical protein
MLITKKWATPCHKSEYRIVPSTREATPAFTGHLCILQRLGSSKRRCRAYSERSLNLSSLTRTRSNIFDDSRAIHKALACDFPERSAVNRDDTSTARCGARTAHDCEAPADTWNGIAARHPRRFFAPVIRGDRHARGHKCMCASAARTQTIQDLDSSMLRDVAAKFPAVQQKKKAEEMLGNRPC